MSLAAKLAVRNNNNRLTRTYTVTTRTPGEWEVVGGEEDMVGSTTEVIPEAASVSLSKDGRRIAFGQVKHVVAGNTDVGRVRIFDINEDGTLWEQVGSEILGTLGVIRPRFGGSVSLSDDGSILSASSSTEVTVYRYDLPLDQWLQLGNVISYTNTIETSAVISSTGTRIAVSDNTTVVVYEYDGVSLWQPVGSSIPGSTNVSSTGIALANNGFTIAIGSVTSSNQGGVVRVYTYTNDWTQVGNTLLGISDQRLIDTNGIIFTFGSRFGTSVALSSNGLVLAVGEPRYLSVQNQNVVGGESSGRSNAFKYNAASNTWDRMGGPEDLVGARQRSEVGYSVSLSADGSILAYSIAGYSSILTEPLQTLDYQGRFRVVRYSHTWQDYGTGQEKMVGVTYGRRPETSSVSLASDGRTVAISEPTFSYTGSGQSLSYEGRARVLTLPMVTSSTNERMCCAQLPRNNQSAPILENKTLTVTRTHCQAFPQPTTKVVYSASGRAIKCSTYGGHRNCNSSGVPCGGVHNERSNCLGRRRPARAGLRNVSANHVAKLATKARATPQIRKNVCSLWGQDTGRVISESDVVQVTRSEAAASVGIAGTGTSASSTNCKASLHGNIPCFSVGSNVGAVHYGGWVRTKECDALNIPAPERGYVQHQNKKEKLCALRLPTVKRIGPLSGAELVSATAENTRRTQRISWRNNLYCSQRKLASTVTSSTEEAQSSANLTTVIDADNQSASLLIEGPLTEPHRQALLALLVERGGTRIRRIEVGTAITSVESQLFNADSDLESLVFKDPTNSQCTSIGFLSFGQIIGLNNFDLILPPSIAFLGAGAFVFCDFKSVTFMGGPNVLSLYAQSVNTQSPVSIPVFAPINGPPLVNNGLVLTNAAQFPTEISTTVTTGSEIDRTSDIIVFS